MLDQGVYGKCVDLTDLRIDGSPDCPPITPMGVELVRSPTVQPLAARTLFSLGALYYGAGINIDLVTAWAGDRPLELLGHQYSDQQVLLGVPGWSNCLQSLPVVSYESFDTWLRASEFVRNQEERYRPIDMRALLLCPGAGVVVYYWYPLRLAGPDRYWVQHTAPQSVPEFIRWRNANAQS